MLKVFWKGRLMELELSFMTRLISSIILQVKELKVAYDKEPLLSRIIECMRYSPRGGKSQTNKDRVVTRLTHPDISKLARTEPIHHFQGLPGDLPLILPPWFLRNSRLAWFHQLGTQTICITWMTENGSAKDIAAINLTFWGVIITRTWMMLDKLFQGIKRYLIGDVEATVVQVADPVMFHSFTRVWVKVPDWQGVWPWKK